MAATPLSPEHRNRFPLTSVHVRGVSGDGECWWLGETDCSTRAGDRKEQAPRWDGGCGLLRPAAALLKMAAFPLPSGLPSLKMAAAFPSGPALTQDGGRRGVSRHGKGGSAA